MVCLPHGEDLIVHQIRTCKKLIIVPIIMNLKLLPLKAMILNN